MEQRIGHARAEDDAAAEDAVDAPADLRGHLLGQDQIGEPELDDHRHAREDLEQREDEEIRREGRREGQERVARERAEEDRAPSDPIGQLDHEEREDHAEAREPEHEAELFLRRPELAADHGLDQAHEPRVESLEEGRDREQRKELSGLSHAASVGRGTSPGKRDSPCFGPKQLDREVPC